MFPLTRILLKKESSLPLLTAVRYFNYPDIEATKSLKEKLQESNKYDPTIDFKVDIGLPPKPPLTKRVTRERLQYVFRRKQNFELEKQSAKLLLTPDYEDIRKEWLEECGPIHVKMAAEHYNIFNDLFGDAYFTPMVMMDIYYPLKNRGLEATVYRGNVIKPSEAFSQPVVEIPSSPDELWTLTLVNPDGHFTEENMEYVHWLVGNIPEGDVSKGEVIWDYLPPFPPRGMGFQRFIFVLYKQDRKIDYSKLKKKLPCLELKERTFKTLEFYRERQDDMTPAGLSFFQSDWDKSSRKVYHEILNMEEPVFEYDMPPKPYKEQQWFPKKQPFDMYLDRYRDPKDVAQELILKKLKDVDPFQPPKKPFPYPKGIRSAAFMKPSWLATKETRFKLGRGRAAEIKREEYE